MVHESANRVERIRIRNAVEDWRLSLLQELHQQMKDNTWDKMFAKTLQFSWLKGEGADVKVFLAAPKIK